MSAPTLEVHGVANKVSLKPIVTLVFCRTSVHIETGGYSGQKLSAESARYLARKLYHLARKVEKYRAEHPSSPSPEPQSEKTATAP